MKALATLRHLTILVLFTLTTGSVSATDRAKKVHKAALKPAVEQAGKPQRKEVAPFVDPTAPLAELVERERNQRTGNE